jgi:hypothetical protein
VQPLRGKDGTMSQKGRKTPDPPIDHAAQLRERLGRAAYDAIPDDGAPPWNLLTEAGRDDWRTIGQAVMDVIVDKGDRRGEFVTSSIYGYASGQPYVNTEVSVSPMQVTPAKAREMALMLLESADASESDAVLIGFARTALGLDDQRAAQLLNQFRQYRIKQLGTEAKSA